MASNSNYYIDTASFSTATAVWTDAALTTKAPDGYYSDTTNYRQQVNGLLQSVVSCTVPQGPSINVSDVISFSVSPFNGGPGGGGTASGTITVIGGTYRIKASASVYTNNSTNVWVNATVNGVSMYAERNNSTGTTKSGNYVDLPPGTYSYSINVSGNGLGGSGSAGLDIVLN
ncbi:MULTISPECIES: hypothetical protein [Flavobacterium]|uniref:Uncharacterized protein n=1 Tax=Flavobacterium keumense TaxID=1306518 RepID=A0ABY8N296_9FLAO|nr:MULTISPECIES: hypothetical protein [Flavobacterium]WGK93788.1 hypothetical protein MG292_06705 [Flavobacterium keumense]